MKLHWYDKHAWWNFTVWHIGNIHISYHSYIFWWALLSGICFYSALMIIATDIISPSKKFSYKHRILSMGAGKALIAIPTGFISWILIPLLDKLIFIFTPILYKKKVIVGVENKIHALYKTKIKDFERQINIITSDRDQWKKAWEDQRDSIDQSYWAGAKRGYTLSEKRLSKNKNKAKSKEEVKGLTEAQIFALREICKGNQSVNGLAASFLEDHGYVELVSKNGGQHYEITRAGIDYIRADADELLKKLGNVW
jgi:hypothetical protein